MPTYKHGHRFVVCRLRSVLCINICSRLDFFSVADCGLAMASSPSPKSRVSVGGSDRDGHVAHLKQSPQTWNADEDDPDEETPPLFLGFNQDSTRLACGTERGFRVYELCGGPIREYAKFESSRGRGGGIGRVELMYDRGFAALVGGGTLPAYPPHKVMMWDFNQGRCTGELCFKSPVRTVKLRMDKLIVLLELKVFVYDFETLGLLFSAETLPNPKGLCALSAATSSPFVFACPGMRKGEVRVEQLRSRKLEKKMTRDTTMIAAHDSHLACIALSVDGRLLATASNKGTLIRIFSTFDGTHLQEVYVSSLCIPARHEVCVETLN